MIQVLAGFVALDQLFKRAALLILRQDEPVDSGSLFQLVLRLNLSGMGSEAQEHLPSGAQGMSWMSGSVAFNLLFASTLVLFHRRQWPLLWGTVVGVVIGIPVVGMVMSLDVTDVLSAEHLKTVIAAQRASSLAVYVTAWWLLTLHRSTWRLVACLFMACGTSNLIDYVVPPYAGIDYIYSSPVSYLFGLGVFNLADVAYLLAKGVGVILVIRAVWRFLFRSYSS
ncbi:MAG: signal peptidase II [Polyangiaceae bacterium]|nr:signal peptidase II [Polyangiaceae bacterium]